MKSEFFIDALEFLDDKLLIEADEKRVNRKKIIYFRTAVAMAACILLVIVAGLVLGGPYKDKPQLLAGKDWRLFREGSLELPEETEDGIFVADATDEPAVTFKPTNDTRETVAPSETGGGSVLVPAGTPAATKTPVNNKPMETKGPVTERPVQTYVPVETETLLPTESSDPLPIESSRPSPTDSPVETDTPVVTDTPAPTADDTWTYYIAENDTESGEGQYGIEYTFVMAWFSSGLNVECEAVTPTPEAPLMTETPEPGETTAPEYPGANTTSSPSTAPTEIPEPTNVPDAAPPDDNVKDEGETWTYSVGKGNSVYSWQKREIPAEYIENICEGAVLNGKSSWGKKKSISVSAYKIAGVSMDAAVAVKLSSKDGYYMFVNKSYNPDTFLEFVEAYNLTEYLTWESFVNYDAGIMFGDLSSNNFWNRFLQTDGSRVSAEEIYKNNVMSAALGMDIELYGYNNIPVALYKEGYVIFYLFNQGYAFDIGEEAVAKILQ